MNSASISAAKQQLRSLVRSNLAHVTPESIANQSRRAFDTLRSLKPYEEAERISIFLAMPSGEIQTDAIVRHALSAGKQVYIPYLHKSPFAPGEGPPRVMDMVRLRDLEDYESLQPDKWGIPSIDSATVNERQRILGGSDPNPADSSTPLDLILMPGVAFDIEPETGILRRLGHGKGFYDFFIERYRAKTKPAGHPDTRPVLLYGLALAEQFLTPDSGTPVPVGPHDKSLHGVILGNGEVKRPSDRST
ncbi:5-formyltetrahydrofolate cyclo-ligase [Sodiomyces alkalinus F11]|uniref:5-formyltetrahydrofolate cyclo-ligase n=1 Tax=Sodiomyces alkalinus (strain CBS 110278 / VKM F-3762 / F11) TaxID=1314773 RepID=A0A3N2PW73_SODAK|nr:5-formyltetrahydrofolate cyclo-ligase [Sodiomyces alkalinus F11]ROT38727.1 5-formyltetrahydrofolate cyclo-ligase [Sodiomyces alkalinus F11]